MLKREKSLPPERVIRMLAQVAIGLDQAHARQFVHRDLKPDNLFLCGTREGDDGPSGAIWLRDADGGDNARRLDTHREVILDARFARDGKTLAALGHFVRLWDADGGRHRKLPEPYVRAFDLSPGFGAGPEPFEKPVAAGASSIARARHGLSGVCQFFAVWASAPMTASTVRCCRTRSRASCVRTMAS